MGDQKPLRGLSALLQKTTDKPAATQTEVVSNSYANINEIRANPNQPRKEFDEEALNELALSIKEKGLLQPIVVRTLSGNEVVGEIKYEIIAGERRWRACKRSNIEEVPIYVKEVEGNAEIMMLSLIENLQRDNLNSMEECEAYQYLKKDYGLTQEQIAQSVSKSRSYVANSLRMADLPDEIKSMLRDSKLSMGHAKVLLGVQDKQLQLKLAKQCISEKTSVRQLEEYISENPIAEGIPKKKAKEKSKSTMVLDIEDRLRNHFGTKVNVVEGLRKGKITVEFYSVEDFDRITRLMGLLD